MIEQTSRIDGTVNINALLAFAFGVIFLSVMLAFAAFFPNPTAIQVRIFLTVLALAAAGVGAVIPGFLDVQVKGIVRAGGALALVLIVLFAEPVFERRLVRLEKPPTPPALVIEQWLQAVDRRDFDYLWANFDPALTGSAIASASDLKTLIDNVRTPLGKPVHRVLINVSEAESPPGAPVGIYSTAFFATQFSKADRCRVEDVTVRASPRLSWKVVSHHVNPTPIDCPESVKPASSRIP